MASKTCVPTLALDYHPDLGDEVAYALERAGRAAGLPLRELELLGQDGTTAVLFVAAVESGDITGFMDDVDWDRLDGRLRQRCVPAIAVPQTV